MPRPASHSITVAVSRIAWSLAILEGEGVTNLIAPWMDSDSRVG